MLGIGEILFLISIVVIIFGARKLPALGSAIGSSMRHFKSGLRGKEGKNGRVSRDVEEYRRQIKQPD